MDNELFTGAGVDSRSSDGVEPDGLAIRCPLQHRRFRGHAGRWCLFQPYRSLS